MAGNAKSDFQPSSYLTPNQQDLLLAALNSNHTASKSSTNLPSQTMHQPTDSGWGVDSLRFDSADSDLSGIALGNQTMSLGGFDEFDASLDESSFLDFLGNGNANNSANAPDEAGDDNDDLNDDDEGSPEEEGDLHEKRKSPGDDSAGQETGSKRHEPQEKVAKKPGRKPLMTEPTNKRKAQNRAAQRAFRERKEKHLKDLETKVAELEKTSESTSSENSLLRAHVARLQTELKEYRKRLSFTGSSLGRSPPLSNGLSSYLANNAGGNTFSFDFPQFGNSSTSNSFGTPPLEKSTIPNTSTTSFSMFPASIPRQNTNGNNPSPRTQSRANSTISSSNSPPQQNGSGPLNNNEGLNSMLTSDRRSSTRTNSTDTAAPHSRIFQFNSNSNSMTSPSNSSNSQYGGNSSAGTSPEPMQNSPAAVNLDNSLSTINETGFGDFPKVSSPLSSLQPSIEDNNAFANLAAQTNSNTDTLKGIEWFAAQNGGQFDPTLFGDYRDSQLAIVGDGDFTGGFFNSTMPMADLSSPFNWDNFPIMPTGLTPMAQKPNPLEQADLIQQVAFEPSQNQNSSKSNDMMDCNKIWDKLQGNKDFAEGNFDIDNLCSELRAKAKCSEGGAVIDKKDVDAALERRNQQKKNSAHVQ